MVYTGQIIQARSLLEELVDRGSGCAWPELGFNLGTLNELTSAVDRSRGVEGAGAGAGEIKGVNTDFKL